MRQKGHACRQAGIVGIFVLVLVLAIAVAGGAYYLGRVSTKLQPVKTQQPVEVTPSPDPTVNWKTYTNTQYGFSFKYPNDWATEQTQSGGEYKTIISIKPEKKVGPNGTVTISSADPYVYIDIVQRSINKEKLRRESSVSKFSKIQLAGRDAYTSPRLQGIEGSVKEVLVDAGDNKTLFISTQNRLDVLDFVLSTFKFIDQTATPTTSPKGKFCGGIAGNLPENQCPAGYKCQLDYIFTERTDSGGKCVKE